jgi:hypothetical protein
MAFDTGMGGDVLSFLPISDSEKVYSEGTVSDDGSAGILGWESRHFIVVECWRIATLADDG